MNILTHNYAYRCIFACLFGSMTLVVQAQYDGRVFVDANHNNVFDKGEKTLAGVSVSDGLNVVKTDSKGYYSLPGHEKERFLFITTPSGYKTDNAYYRRISKEYSTYDFGIVPYQGGIQKDGAHKFIHISDTEIGETQGHDDWIGNLRDYSANEGAAFIVHTGDICYTPGLDSHIQIMNTANMVNTQVFYCVGNHDLVKGAYGEEHFEKLYGPSFYSFEVGNVHYIVTPMFGGDYQPSYRKEDVYRWIQNDLKQVEKGKSIYVFNHSIADDTENFRLKINEMEVIDLPAHKLKAWLYGHWHVNHIHKHDKADVHSICSSTPIYGGIDHASSAFRVLHVDAQGEFTSDLRYCYMDKSVHIASIGNDMHTPILPSGSISLSVNAYTSASPTTSVSCTILNEKQETIGKVALAQQTDFNWYAELPVSTKWNNCILTAVAEVHFRNGEVAKVKRPFLYQTNSNNKPCSSDDQTNLLGTPQHADKTIDTLALPLRLAWVRNVGSNLYMASPLVYKGMIIVASVDDNESMQASVTGMDAVTGTVRWKCPVKASVRNSIAITDGKVFAQDVHGTLYAINAESGILQWTKDLGLSMIPPLNDGLLAAKGVVYAGTGKSLCAFQAADGKLIWQNKDWNRGEGCTATLSLNDNILIGHAHWGNLYANDATTGRMLWQGGGSDLVHRSASAAMLGDVLYLISAKSFYIIESRTGHILARKELGYDVNVASTPLVTDKEIIFGTAERGIVSLDKETLNEKWNFHTKPSLIYSAPYIKGPAATVETSPVLSGNAVFAGASDGTIYAVDRHTGKQLWKYETGTPIFATVAISGNALYATDFSGNVYAFTENHSTQYK